MFVLFISFIAVSGEEITVYEEVYCDDISGQNHFSDIRDAIEHVADYGKVYIGKDINIDDSNENIFIDKSIQIISLNPNQYKINFSKFNLSLFNLMHTEYFKISGVKIKGKNSEIIEGNTLAIDISNSYFEYCYPIMMSYPNNNMDISITNSHFIDSTIKLAMNSYSGNIDISDNIFETNLLTTSTIDLNRVNITAERNIFNNIVLKLAADSGIDAYVTDNTFDGSKGKIYITADGQNMHFNRNKMLKNINFEVFYTGINTIDFTNNWWDDIEGPSENRVYGNIDYSNWALFGDFSRYKNDPYSIEDLKAAIENLGQAVDDRSFIYDMNGDGQIEFLDLVWITRILKY